MFTICIFNLTNPAVTVMLLLVNTVISKLTRLPFNRQLLDKIKINYLSKSFLLLNHYLTTIMAQYLSALQLFMVTGDRIFTNYSEYFVVMRLHTFSQCQRWARPIDVVKDTWKYIKYLLHIRFETIPCWFVVTSTYISRVSNLILFFGETRARSLAISCL